MVDIDFNLLDPGVPVVFSDGSAVYAKLREAYVTHETGWFILAPSGAGKTYFVDHQTTKDWIDGDVLWMATNAHPDGAWWTESLEHIFEIDRRSDVITVEAKKLGFWVVGASNNSLKPDAIVIPEWEQHKKWIAARESSNYDGGATSDKLDQVVSHRKAIMKWEEQGVPKFETVQAAVDYLTAKHAS